MKKIPKTGWNKYDLKKKFNISHIYCPPFQFCNQHINVRIKNILNWLKLD
jgi:hypothetical protein